MRQILRFLVLALLLSGCAGTQSQRDRVLVGAGLGAATGATIGAVAGSGVNATLAGAALGAIGGGFIGAVTQQTCIAKAEDGSYFEVPCP